MATEKKPTRYLSGRVEMKATFAQLRDKKEKKGPRQLGQQKNLLTVHLGKISQPQLIKRLAAAKSVLETGRVPAAAKGGAPATKDPTIAKAKGDLTKANNKIEALKKELAEALSVIPSADPIKK